MRPSRQRFPFLHPAVRRIALLGTASLLGAIPSPVSAQTQLATVNRDGTGTANGGSFGSAFSADGRFMVFVSSASDLLSNDTPGQNVYVRNLENGTTTLVSVNHLGTGGGNGQFFSPVISPDGRFVAFASTASNLVANDKNLPHRQDGSLTDVFVRDLQARVTHLVSVNLTGTDSGEDESFTPSISADGSVVAFYSKAKNLVSNPKTACSFADYVTNVYVRHLPDGPTRLVSVNGAGSHGCGESYGYIPPSISADGGFVAFMSTAFDLAGNDTNRWGGDDVFVRDLKNDTTTLVSVNRFGDTGDWVYAYPSEYPFMSADGRFVVFTSASPDLVSSDANGRIRDVFVRDLLNEQTSLVSVNALGVSGNGLSFAQAITTDGRFVAFYSNATDLAIIGDTNVARDVFVRDLQDGTTAVASVSQAGTTTGDGESLLGGISADGRYVAFVSAATDLVSNDGNGAYDVFFRDMQAGTTSLASVNTTGTDSGNNWSYAPFISQDGALVAFTSLATDLIGLPDSNQGGDVFIRPVVPTPQQALADLIALLQSFVLPKGLENSLSSKLENAQKSLAAGNTSAACGQIGAFINQIEGQSGKHLTTAQASQLVAAAGAIRATLGCS